MRGHLIVAATVFACFSSTLAACGQSTKPAGTISILPADDAKGRSWSWTAACPNGPQKATGCETAGPELGVSQLAGNEWNLGGGQPGSESVQMKVSPSGSLSLNANFTTAPPCTATMCIAREANTWVRGYPSVLYGIDECHAQTAPPQSPELTLPARVDSIPADLIGRATYIAQASQVTHDVAYDLWLSASATKTPCQTDGTIEVMVWTGYGAEALLPDSLKVGTTTIPFEVNGTLSGDQSWSVYVNNVYGGGHTAPWGGTVWLVPDDPTEQGDTAVDLSAALGAVGTVLHSNYGWAPFASTYWLDTIAFGIEYGPRDANPYGNGSTNFSLDLSSYCLQVRTTVPAAQC